MGIGITFLLLGWVSKYFSFFGWLIHDFSALFLFYSSINILYIQTFEKYKDDNNKLYSLFLFNPVIKWFVKDYKPVRFMVYKIASGTKPPKNLINILKLTMIIAFLSINIFVNSIAGIFYGISINFTLNFSKAIMVMLSFGLCAFIMAIITLVSIIIYIRIFNKLILSRNDVTYLGDILEKALINKFLSYENRK
ncbi:hypothetical protein MCRO_0172 [Mycoplasma crocodyli MP145]|uniref:Uncharacterized protein n=1 Tax=Mycoplasma crocodyli (strain ATCC 51981 / MP145) TaxID=512564 RepID=D5E500_MYCCM|nr:hypothetical protein MCRO_0172 [Mycoplasma crocodyli MP145]